MGFVSIVHNEAMRRAALEGAEHEIKIECESPGAARTMANRFYSVRRAMIKEGYLESQFAWEIRTYGKIMAIEPINGHSVTGLVSNALAQAGVDMSKKLPPPPRQAMSEPAPAPATKKTQSNVDSPSPSKEPKQQNAYGIDFSGETE